MGNVSRGLVAVGIVWCATSMLSAQRGGAPADIAVGQARAVQVAKGGTLQIKGVSADMDVVPGTGADPVVTVTNTGTDPPPRITLLVHDGSATICTVYVSDKPDKPNECIAAEGKGRLDQGVKKTSSVKFRVELPAEVRFVGQVTTGSYKWTAGANDLSLKTLLGDVTIVDKGSRELYSEIGLRGTLTAFIAPDTGAARRIVLKIASGKLIVAVPNVPITYTIMSDTPISTPFKLAAPVGPTRQGRIGPAGDARISLALDSGTMFGSLSLQRRTDLK